MVVTLLERIFTLPPTTVLGKETVYSRLCSPGLVTWEAAVHHDGNIVAVELRDDTALSAELQRDCGILAVLDHQPLPLQFVQPLIGYRNIASPLHRYPVLR